MENDCEEKVIKEEKICCPNCNTEQILKATWRVCDPFVNYTHECIKCLWGLYKSKAEEIRAILALSSSKSSRMQGRMSWL